MRYNNDGLSFLVKMSKRSKHRVTISRIKTTSRFVC